MLRELFPAQDPVLIFALLMLIALLAPLVSFRLKLPGIIGLIVAGMMLGPHALGVLERGYEVQLLGGVGLLYIMFLAGLELDRVQFIRHRYHSLVFGLMTFSIPLVFGSLMAHYLLAFDWKAAILLASMFSSHTLLTYPIASRLGLPRQRAVTTTIGGTIITDTAALLVLAIIAAMHKGDTGVFFWPQLFIRMIIYVAAILIILPRLGKWFFRNIATDGVVAFSGVIAAVYLCAWLALIAGLEPIIGAFLAGLILNIFIPEKSALMNRIQFVGHSLFIPFFLISVGMLVDLRMLFSANQALVIALAMVLAGIITKWLAAFSTQKILKYTPEEGKLIYGLSVNQAAATLAAVIVGYNIGIFGEVVLTGTITMILVTSLVGSWVTDRFAYKVALKEEEEPYKDSAAPQRILIPLANPHTAAELMSLAILLRQRNSREPLYPLTVVQSGERIDERVANAEKLLGHAVVQALEADVPVTPVTRVATDTIVGIQQAALDLRISTIIAGWQGDVSSRSKVFGRILDSVLDNSAQMALISRCLAPINTTKRVVLAVPALIDHQPGFAIAIRAIKTLAHQIDASLLTVSVPETLERIRQVVRSNLPKIHESDVQLEKWADLFPWLKKALSQDDLLIVMSVRKGRLPWRPNLHQIPRLISQELSKINYLIVYPPERFWGEELSARENKEILSSFFPVEHIRLDLSERSVSEAISCLISPAFTRNQAAVKKIADKLTQMAESEPIELSPGIILLHAHISEIQTCIAFLGVNKKGWKLPHVTQKVQALVILLNSKFAPPELHLKALADLVRPLRHFHNAQELMRLTSPEEVIKMFSG